MKEIRGIRERKIIDSPGGRVADLITYCYNNIKLLMSCFFDRTLRIHELERIKELDKKRFPFSPRIIRPLGYEILVGAGKKVYSLTLDWKEKKLSSQIHEKISFKNWVRDIRIRNDKAYISTYETIYLLKEYSPHKIIESERYISSFDINNRILVYGTTTGELTFCDLTTGKVLKRVHLPNEITYILLYENKALVGLSNGALISYNLDNLKERKIVRLPGRIKDLKTLPEYIVVTLGGGEIHFLDKNDLTRKNKIRVNDKLAKVTFDESMIYIGGWRGIYRARITDQNTGIKRIIETGVYITSFTYSLKALFLGFSTGLLIVYDHEEGRIKKLATAKNCVKTLIIMNDSLWVLEENGIIEQIRLETNEICKETRALGPIWRGQEMNNNIIVAGSNYVALYDGDEWVWIRELKYPPRSLLIRGKNIFIGDTEGFFYWFRDDGEQIMMRKLSIHRILSTEMEAENDLLIGTQTGEIIRINLRTGRESLVERLNGPVVMIRRIGKKTIACGGTRILTLQETGKSLTELGKEVIRAFKLTEEETLIVLEDGSGLLHPMTHKLPPGPTIRAATMILNDLIIARGDNTLQIINNKNNKSFIRRSI